MEAANNSGPQWSGGAMRFIVWIAVAYACIMAFKYLDEPVMAFFASLTVVMLVWVIEDFASNYHSD